MHSDSNHNRILIIDTDNGQIIHKIGGKSRGLQEKNFEEALFFRPQGVAWIRDKIYVADTYNHAIGLIDLILQKVLTGKPEMKMTATTMMCNIDDPSCDTLGLFEPSDVKISGTRLISLIQITT